MHKQGKQTQCKQSQSNQFQPSFCCHAESQAADQDDQAQGCFALSQGCFAFLPGCFAFLPSCSESLQAVLRAGQDMSAVLVDALQAIQLPSPRGVTSRLRKSLATRVLGKIARASSKRSSAVTELPGA